MWCWPRSSRRCGLLPLLLLLRGLAAGQPEPTEAVQQQEVAPTAGAIAAPRALAPVFGRYTFWLTVGGLQRRVVMYVPHSYRREAPVPLWILGHGTGATPEHFLRQSSIEDFAERRTFAFVAPAGVQGNLNARCLPGKPDDVEFVQAALREVKRSLNVDMSRIHCVGFSRGARWCSMLATKLSTFIGSIGVVGGIRFPHPNYAVWPVSVIAFHGLMDPVNPFHGNGARYWKGSVPHVIREWAKFNRCRSHQMLKKAASVLMSRRFNCAQGSEVQLFMVEGGGHTWPGSQYHAVSALGATNQDIHATELIWRFFEDHHGRPTCHTAVAGRHEQCFHMVRAGMRLGVSPWQSASSAEQVQADLHRDIRADCAKPCPRPEVRVRVAGEGSRGEGEAAEGQARHSWPEKPRHHGTQREGPSVQLAPFGSIAFAALTALGIGSAVLVALLAVKYSWRVLPLRGLASSGTGGGGRPFDSEPLLANPDLCFQQFFHGRFGDQHRGRDDREERWTEAEEATAEQMKNKLPSLSVNGGGAALASGRLVSAAIPALEQRHEAVRNLTVGAPEHHAGPSKPMAQVRPDPQPPLGLATGGRPPEAAPRLPGEVTPTASPSGDWQGVLTLRAESHARDGDQQAPGPALDRGETDQELRDSRPRGQQTVDVQDPGFAQESPADSRDRDLDRAHAGHDRADDSHREPEPERRRDDGGGRPELVYPDLDGMPPCDPLEPPDSDDEELVHAIVPAPVEALPTAPEALARENSEDEELRRAIELSLEVAVPAHERPDEDGAASPPAIQTPRDDCPIAPSLQSHGTGEPGDGEGGRPEHSDRVGGPGSEPREETAAIPLGDYVVGERLAEEAPIHPITQVQTLRS